MDRLLQKVTDLEVKVSTDVNRPAAVAPKWNLKKARNDDTESNASSDKMSKSSVKQMLGSLFKGKRI